MHTVFLQSVGSAYFWRKVSLYSTESVYIWQRNDYFIIIGPTDGRIALFFKQGLRSIMYRFYDVATCTRQRVLIPEATCALLEFVES